MTLLSPAWLLLLVPAGMLWWWLRPGSTVGAVLRGLLLGLIVVAACEPAWWLSRRAGTVVVLADRSASMPAEADAAQLEAVSLLHASMESSRHRLAVVSFGQGTAVELPPGDVPLPGWTQPVGGGASDLAAALRRAQALIPADAPGRVLLLSDGRYTGQAPWPEAATLGARGVAVDTRLIARPRTGDAAVLDVQAPELVAPGEAFMVTAWVDTPIAQSLRYTLVRGTTVVAAGQRDFAGGAQRLRFRDRVLTPGSAGYELLIEQVDDAGATSGSSGGGDPVPENNRARFVVGVQGARPLLHITQTPGAQLGSLLGDAGLRVTTRTPEQLDGEIAELANHAAVLLENVAAADLPVGTLEQLAALIEETGTGLLMTGGGSAFGPGGYFQSAIDPLLPVSMELRQEHRKLSMAIVVALDRSGSMAMTVPGGRMKMDLANLGTAQVLDLLSPMDELGVIAVDSAPHTIIDLQPVDDKDAMRRKVLSIDSMGGGIYVYEALEASARMIADANAGTKHIILFADAQDAENPANYVALLEQCRRANITVSVIGLGTAGDVDAPLLRDIAARGGGRVFFTNDARKLPALFAQDTFAVARSAFIDELTGLQATAALTALLGGPPASGQPVAGGYNLTYLRPEASPAIVTTDEYRAPFVATWSAGLGRTAALAGEADGKHTAPLNDWPAYGDTLVSLARYALGRDGLGGESGALPETLMARRRVADGQLHVELLLDPDRPTLDLPAEPTARVLLTTPGEAPRRLTLPLRYAAPDRLSATVPLTSADTAVAALDLGTLGHAALPPARLLYDPEYRPAARDDETGEPTLQRIMNLSQGRPRVDLPAMWDDLPTSRRAVPIAWVFWLAAAAALLLDVLERRTSLLSDRTAAPSRLAVASSAGEAAQRPSRFAGWWWRKPSRRSPSPARTTSPAASDVALSSSSASTASTSSSDGDLSSAFEAASRKSQSRTQRGP